MADYKQVPAFCYHCNKQVVANKEEIDHKFWLIASCLSCGLFAFVWILKMLTHNPPAMCSQCGLAIGKNPQMPNAIQANQTSNAKCVNCGLTNFATATACKRCNTPLPKQAQPTRTNFVPQNSDEATGKGLSPVAKFAIASVIGVFAMLVLIRIIGDVSSIATSKQAVTTSQTPQSVVTPQTTPNPIQQTKKGKGKEASPTKQVEGFRMKDDEGNLRGYSLACHRQANELGQDIDIKVRIFVFEKCIQYEGDGDTAKREAIYMIRQAQGQ